MFVLGSQDSPNPYVSSVADGTASIALQHSRLIASALADNRDTLNSLVSASIADVMREYPAFMAARDSNPAAYARQAVVMAMLSPQLLFRHNLELAQNFCAALADVHTLADVRRALRYTTADGSVSTRFNGCDTKAGYLLAALPYLRSIRGTADVTRDSLLALRGVGPKVAAFALHMVEWNADVFTLDIHMLRIFAQIAGLPVVGNMTITTAAYRELERACIDLFRAQFPAYPLFAVQWALWDCARGFHQNHEDLFA